MATEVERFEARTDDGEVFTVVKYKHPPVRNINGGLLDLEEFDFALADGTPLTRMSAEGTFMLPPPNQRLIRRV